jgi:hypothetical protein|tara:strand:- start:1086 stop:1214 length:129 start_codon:yes stop_codon:yes gene_type:complete
VPAVEIAAFFSLVSCSDAKLLTNFGELRYIPHILDIFAITGG